MTELETELAKAYQRLEQEFKEQSTSVLELAEQVKLLTNSKSSASRSEENTELRLSSEQENSACSNCRNALWTKKASADTYSFECLIATKVTVPVAVCNQKS
jgi:hypothetical protein